MKASKMKKQAQEATFVDRENAFMLYATFCGDLEKTAHALKVQPVDVARVADEDNWNAKLRGILEQKKSARPGDIERAINRALNFVQAARFRHVVDRAITRLYGMTPDQFQDTVFKTVTMNGEVVDKMSAKGLADLASAMEKAQAMSYQALTDTATDRGRRLADKPDDASAQSLHVQIAEGMAKVGKSNSPRATLFEEQLQKAKQLVDESKAKEAEAEE